MEIFQEFALEEEIASVDPIVVKFWLFSELNDAVLVQLKFAKPGRRIYTKYRANLSFCPNSNSEARLALVRPSP